MKVFIELVFLSGLIALSTAVMNLSQCRTVKNPIEGLDSLVTIGACKKPPCRLRKNTVVKVEIKLKPEKDIEKLVNSINAIIVGVPFPFIGYDQTDACANIFSKDGKTKLGCPLKGGQEYLYKNPIDVLQIYPRVKTVVHWGLTMPDQGDLICFEVPARITN